MPPTIRRKIAVIGDAAVGKSALVQMFASSGTRFPKQYNMTCGVELAHKMTHVRPPAVDSEANVELYLFDSSGQDIFAEMLPPCWEGTEGVIVVYDVTRQHTFDACEGRYRHLLEMVGGHKLPGAVVANKVDLHERSVVERGMGERFARAYGLGYFETSAKDGDGVDGPFQHVAAGLLKQTDAAELPP